MIHQRKRKEGLTRVESQQYAKRLLGKQYSQEVVLKRAYV